MKWIHEPETNEYTESWSGEQDGVKARVYTVHAGIYTAHVYPRNNHQQIGDIYKSPSSAKSACKRRLDELAAKKQKESQ